MRKTRVCQDLPLESVTSQLFAINHLSVETRMLVELFTGSFRVTVKLRILRAFVTIHAGGDVPGITIVQTASVPKGMLLLMKPAAVLIWCMPAPQLNDWLPHSAGNTTLAFTFCPWPSAPRNIAQLA